MTHLKNIVVAVASIVIFTNITQAQNLKANYSVGYEEPLKVKYLGSDGDYLRFEVTFDSKTPERARFTIEDKNEGELYSSYFEGTSKVQTIKIEKSAYEALNFHLNLGKKNYSKSFSVNTSVVHTTVVAERDVATL